MEEVLFFYATIVFLPNILQCQIKLTLRQFFSDFFLVHQKFRIIQSSAVPQASVEIIIGIQINKCQSKSTQT